LLKARQHNGLGSTDSSIHLTEDGDGVSSNESEERGAEDNMALKVSDTLLQKMDNLKVLLRKKKRVEEKIARAQAELQEALQP
jgi:hypothetical protein